MKKTVARLLTAMVMLSLMVSQISGMAVVTNARVTEYSTYSNSGIRHVVCTSLAGTGVAEYYTGDYTYEKLSQQSGRELLRGLRQLMTSTHTTETTYSQCRDMAVRTDCQNADGLINLIYSGYIASMEDYINTTSKGWNREHVWPVSRGGFSKEQTPGCDLHHIRPSDSSINGQRGNEIYGEVENGNAITGTIVTGNALGGYSDGKYFEPLDHVKGDVARICLYMYVRYGGAYSKCGDITNVFQSVDVLLQWCAEDPVDTWEMGRNEVVGEIQGNRNVFIDYPELAWLIFDREVPADLVSPSDEPVVAEKEPGQSISWIWITVGATAGAAVLGCTAIVVTKKKKPV